MLTRNEGLLLQNQAQNNPDWYCSHVLNSPLWLKQKLILESIRDNKRTAVPSCHGAGKSYVASRAALWFLFSFPNSKVITTAPTFRQVEQIIWQELRSCYKKAPGYLGGRLYPVATKLAVDDNWFALGMSSDKSDNFQGWHAENLLFIVDEACGCPPEMFGSIEGCLTGPGNKILSIGNPTDPTTFFRRDCLSKYTNTIRISAYDTPNFQGNGVVIPGLITPQWVEYIKTTYGEESSYYQSRVLGQFPQNAADALIPLHYIERAQAQSYDDFGEEFDNHLGVDVARMGEDKTVIVHRMGRKLTYQSISSKEDTMQTVGRVIRAIHETGATQVRIDDIGVGGGVTDRLKEMGSAGEFDCAVVPVNVSEKSKPDALKPGSRFVNLRAEYYWHMRELFEFDKIDIPADDDTAAQLSILRYKVKDSGGAIYIPPKDELRKELGGASPDLADALMLATAPIKYASTGDQLLW